jgi:hypothetical protein
MSIKRYSDFDTSNVQKTTAELKSTPAEVKMTISNEPINTENSIEAITEELLLAPKVELGDSVNIEILEEKIIKFNSGHITDIMETIKEKYSDTDYFIRSKDNQLHIVKYNESLKVNINEFVNSLLKFYSSNNELKKILEGIKVKGNQNFTIVENMKPQFSPKFIDDLSKLLAKKK